MNIDFNYFEGNIIHEKNKEEYTNYKIKNCYTDTQTCHSNYNLDTQSTKSNESQTFRTHKIYESNDDTILIPLEYKTSFKKEENIVKIPRNAEEILRKYKRFQINYKEYIENIIQELKEHEANKNFLSICIEKINTLIVSPGLLSPDSEKEFKEIQEANKNNKIKNLAMQQRIQNFLEKNVKIFDINKLNESIQHQKVLKDSEVVSFLGNPGVGKSASILYLCGCELKKISKGKYILENNPLFIQNINNIQIANDGKSQAKIINLIDISSEQLSKLFAERKSRTLSFCESPVGDTSDSESNIANGKIFIDNLKTCNSLKIVYLISKNETKNKNGFYCEVAKTLSSIVPNFNEEILESFLFLFTKFKKSSFEKFKKKFCKNFKNIKEQRKTKINEKEILVIEKILQQMESNDFESFIDLSNKKSKQSILTAILKMKSIKKSKLEEFFDYSISKGSDALKILERKIDFLKKQCLYALKIQNKFDFALLLDAFYQIDLLQKAIDVENFKELKTIINEFFSEIYAKVDENFFHQSKTFEQSLNLILDEENVINLKNTFENAVIFIKIYEKYFPNQPKIEKFNSFIEIINKLIKKLKNVLNNFDLDDKLIGKCISSSILLKRKFLDATPPGIFEKIDEIAFLKQIGIYLDEIVRLSDFYLEKNELDVIFENINRIIKISTVLDQTVDRIPIYIEILKEKINDKFENYLNSTACILGKMFIFMEEKDDEVTLINIFELLINLKSKSNINNEFKHESTIKIFNEISQCILDFYFKVNEEITKNNSSEINVEKELKYFERRMNQFIFFEKHISSKLIQEIYSAIKKQMNSRFLQIQNYLIEICRDSSSPLDKFQFKKIVRFSICFNQLTCLETFSKIFDAASINIQEKINKILVVDLPNKLLKYEKWNSNSLESIAKYFRVYNHLINMGNSFKDVFPEINSKIEFIIEKAKKMFNSKKESFISSLNAIIGNKIFKDPETLIYEKGLKFINLFLCLIAEFFKFNDLINFTEKNILFEAREILSKSIDSFVKSTLNLIVEHIEIISNIIDDNKNIDNNNLLYVTKKIIKNKKIIEDLEENYPYIEKNFNNIEKISKKLLLLRKTYKEAREEVYEYNYFKVFPIMNSIGSLIQY